MPKLLSQSKHKEFESNLTLQIRNQKERGAENKIKWRIEKFYKIAKFSKLAKFSRLRNFATCELRNFATYEFSQVALFIMPATVHISATVPSCCRFCFLSLLVFFPFSPIVIVYAMLFL